MTVKNERDSPEITLIRRVERFRDWLNRGARREAVQYGISVPEMDVVFALGNQSGLRMGQIARSTLNSAANITRIVKKLEERQLVSRCRCPESDREVIVELTEAGVALFDEVYPRQYEALKARLLTKLSSRQIEAINAVLEDFDDHVE